MVMVWRRAPQPSFSEEHPGSRRRKRAPAEFVPSKGKEISHIQLSNFDA